MKNEDDEKNVNVVKSDGLRWPEALGVWLSSELNCY